MALLASQLTGGIAPASQLTGGNAPTSQVTGGSEPDSQLTGGIAAASQLPDSSWRVFDVTYSARHRVSVKSAIQSKACRNCPAALRALR